LAAGAQLGHQNLDWDTFKKLCVSSLFLVEASTYSARTNDSIHGGKIVTEVALFSIVAFKTLDISQGSVATHLRCGGIFSDCYYKFPPDFDSEIILKIG